MRDRRASSPSSSFQCSRDYDVYISFRHRGIHRNFTGQLYNTLRQKGIHIFMNDEVNSRTKEILQAVEGIKQSSISIIIFSQNYVSCPRCLFELGTIMQCRKRKGNLVIPIFYKVLRSELIESLGMALSSLVQEFKSSITSLRMAQSRQEHGFKSSITSLRMARSRQEHGFILRRFKMSRLALREAADLAGCDVNRFEYEFQCIEEITEVVMRRIGGQKSLQAKAKSSRRNILKWTKGKLLGRGSFGSIYEAINDGDGSFFAVKEVPLSQKDQIVYLEKEIALLRQFEHENIVKYYGTETDQSNLYVFLELATQGSLKSLCRTYPLEDSVVSTYTRQMLDALKYIHDLKVIHRDIKCDNILVNANGSVKIADFGFAEMESNDTKSFKGTVLSMAPEVARRTKEGYGLPADIWSLGCAVLEMSTGKVPYADFEARALPRICKGELPTLPEKLSRDARDFILQCLKVNPNDRPTAAELLNHSFVNGKGRKRKYSETK